MRVTFEKDDIVKMLRQVLGYDIEDDDVVIQTDPFEVQVSKVDVEKLAQPPTEDPMLKGSQELLAALLSKQGEEEKPKDPVGEEEGVITMNDILSQNSQLSTKSTRTPNVKPLGRPLGLGETEEPPAIGAELIDIKEGT